MTLFLKNLNSIRNGFLYKKAYVYVVRSDFTLNFVDFLYKKGILCGYLIEDRKKVKIFLKFLIYNTNDFLVYNNFFKFFTFFEIYILFYNKGGLVCFSTDKGLKTAQEAVFDKVGGYFLCWIKII